jgi:ABC-type nitrate/sulfonate/bicarbonate transport system substrate-binding protein
MRTLATNVFFHHRQPFAEQGIDLDVIYTTTGEPVVRAMLEGKASFTHVCGAPFPAAVGGRGLKFLAAFQTSSFELLAHPSITSLKHLKGKTVNLTGSILRPNLEIALRWHGLSINDVKMADPSVTRGGGRGEGLDQYKRVLEGAVDAYSANPPGSVVAEMAGLQCLLRFGDINPIPTCGILVTEALLREDRDLVKRFMRGLLQSIDDFIRDRSLGISLLRDLPLPQDVAVATYDTTRGYLRPSGELPELVQRLWIEWAKPLVNVTGDVPLDRVYDFSILEEVRTHR